MKPSPVLRERIKSRIGFTTKQVGRGFYRGTGTGSMGAHTAIGGYLVDWRKVRHFVVPNLKDFKLTPYVNAGIYHKSELPTDSDGNQYKKEYDGMQYLKWFKQNNKRDYDWWCTYDPKNGFEARLPQQAEPQPEQQTQRAK